MKKIFAIALALVMVLSMASAFAFCKTGDYDWACAEDVCNFGKATVEVVPYVRSNTACAGESEFVQSDCAAAVVGERVYYAVKLTVPADLNKDWYEKATLSVDYSNLSGTEGGTEIADFGPVTLAAGDVTYANVKDEAGVYWLTQKGATAATVAWGNGWEKEGAAGVTFGNDNIFYGFALKSSAKLCVTLKSEYYPITKASAPSDDKYVDVDKWNVTYREANSNLVFDIFDGTTFKYSAAIVHFNSDDKVEWVASDYDGLEKFVAWDGDKLVKEDGTRVGTSCGNAAKVAEVLKYFNINFGTCITEKAIKANFGWKDEVKSCTEYKTNAMAVVDSECVVAIPKTGDASVLAWLF